MRPALRWALPRRGKAYEAMKPLIWAGFTGLENSSAAKPREALGFGRLPGFLLGFVKPYTRRDVLNRQSS